MISSVFVDRPRLAMVVAIVTAIAGLLSLLVPGNTVLSGLVETAADDVQGASRRARSRGCAPLH